MLFRSKRILLLDDQGKASSAEKGGLADQLVQKGYQVIVPDLNGFGELSEGFKNRSIQDIPFNVWYAGVLTHKSPLAVRVEEIKILVDFINQTPHAGEPQLTGIACGTLTSDLLHAAVIHSAFDQIALINPLISYQSIVQEKNYHSKFVISTPAAVIGKYDLPDLVAALSPAKICMIHPVNSLDQIVDPNLFDLTYQEAKKKYGDSQNLTAVFNEKDVFLQLEQWLNR